MSPSRPETFELEAYIDGELDLERQLAVEAWLAAQPDEAARHMAELRSRTALRLLMRDQTPATSQQEAALARLTRAKGGSARRPALMVAAGVAATALLTFGAYSLRSQPPPYIGEAEASHRVALLRARMPSQVETPVFDAQELLRDVRMTVPAFPSRWRITDVQVFPSQEGPALLIAVTTDQGEELTLFAIRQRTQAPKIPDARRAGAHAVAYWRRGDTSYALTGDGSVAEMDAKAEALAASWGA
jgi:anti-sigma factor RsiW